MTTRRPVSWFLTEAGRRFSYAAVTGAGIALISVKFVPHTLLLNKYKEFVQHYSNGQPAPLPEELMHRFQECLDTLKMAEAHKKLLTPFAVFGFDLFHAGSCKSKFGALVGIPLHFTYKAPSDVEKDPLRVNLQPVDWSSGAGRELAAALVLPEELQRFAMCREVLATQSAQVFLEAAYPPACVVLCYTLAQQANRRLNLYAAPGPVRGALYALSGFFSLGLYFLLKDYTQVHYETQADRRLCELGREYVESGARFYDKLLQRNRALRQLMGAEGERTYSAKGNENFFLRQPRVALVHRKMFFESMLQGDAEAD